MSIIKSLSSINPINNSFNKSIFSSSGGSLIQNGNELSFFGGGNNCGLLNSCGRVNSNIINIDIDIGRHRRRCC